MDVFDAITARRAVKHFDPGHRMQEVEVTRLIEAAMQSPTSFNIQHWRFVTVMDPGLRKEIRAVGNDQAQMTDASLLVVMTADVDAWKKEPQRYWRNAPEEVAELLVNWMGPFHEGQPQLQRDEAQRSIGIAMQTLMLAAQGMGYDSCPMIGFEFDAVAKLIRLPADHCIGPMVAIGKRVKDPWPKPGQLSIDEVRIVDRFPGLIMNPRLPVAGLLLLALPACRSVGVEVSEERLSTSIGLSEAQLREEFGVPHIYSSDSDGVITLGYGIQAHKLWSIDYSTFVEFTLIEDQVTKTRRVSSRPIADKNRAR